jgi:hypothetical protein
MHYPDYIMVGVSVVISQVITRLGHHVTRAREMGSYAWVNCSVEAGWERSIARRTACWLDRRRSS